MRPENILMSSTLAFCGGIFLIHPSQEVAFCFGLSMIIFAVMNRWTRIDLDLADETARVIQRVNTLVEMNTERNAQLTQLADEISKINDRIGPMQLAMNMRNK